jgi:phosphoribosyl-AMP cyclohydrolase
MTTSQQIADTLSKITFNSDGLVPVVAQDAISSEVLMMAWMNREAVEETLTTGRVCYWSRSRQSLWRKGDTSGHTQALTEFYVDCDGDTLLIKVNQVGAACHTGERTCFFTKIL